MKTIERVAGWMFFVRRSIEERSLESGHIISHLVVKTFVFSRYLCDPK